jgi:hypothetical protein
MPRKHNIPLPKNLLSLQKYVKHHPEQISAPMDIIVRITDVGGGQAKGVVKAVGPAVSQLEKGSLVNVPYAGFPGQSYVVLTLMDA